MVTFQVWMFGRHPDWFPLVRAVAAQKLEDLQLADVSYAEALEFGRRVLARLDMG